MTDPSWNWGDSSQQGPTNRSKKVDFYRQQQNTSSAPVDYFQPLQPPMPDTSAAALWQAQQPWGPPSQVPPITAVSHSETASSPYNHSFLPPGGGAAFTTDYSGNLDGHNVPSSTVSGAYGAQFMSDPLLNTARQIGGQFAEQQRERLTNYLSAMRLKYYFAVDTKYVGKKLGVILFPFVHRDWTTKFGPGGAPLSAREDLNAPDLYIPLMAFITYVLVAGFVFGLQKRFSPENLGLLTTNALFYLVLENLLVFVTKYVLNISQSLNVWHALSYSSYKFVGMVFCLISYLIGGISIYYAALAYCIFATVFFLLRSLKTFILDIGYGDGSDGRKRKLYLLLSITVLQSIIMWLLTSSVTSYMPDKYDFAKMAMGLAKSGTGQLPNFKGMADVNIPLQANGDVDYEALLKMP